MRNRTWPVFLIGIGALLLLIFLPGIAALRQSAQIFDEIRLIQRSHEQRQQALFEVERHILQMSVSIRDFLLDNSPQTGSLYRQQFQQLHSMTEGWLQVLSQGASKDQQGMFDRLREHYTDYASTLRPVLEWSPQQRVSRGAFFLREQQRPRRQALLSIADEIRRLNAENYRQRYEEINSSQRKYREQLQVAVAVAFFLGVMVAGATILRISALERQAAVQRDETERAEHELRSLSSRLMSAQEEERRTISRELHDEVGQMLTGLRMELGMLDKLAPAPGMRFTEHLGEAKSLAEQSLRIVRDIAVGLRPSVLDLGLEAALQWQARHFSRRTGTEASVQIAGQLPSLPDSYLTCIYRIVQEALTNSARHSHAKEIQVRVAVLENNLEVVIKDDGVGLPENWAASRGLGLIGIEERAREIGGHVSIQSQQGTGVSIRVRLPVPKEVVT